MFDFAWSEIGLIALVAVVVLGPKELPNAMRSLARFAKQARKLAGEFQGHVNDVIREAELDEIKNAVKQISTTTVGTQLNQMIDPGGELSADLDAEISRAEAAMRAAATAPAPLPPPEPAKSLPPPEAAS